MALQILTGAACLYRLQTLKLQGVQFPAELEQYYYGLSHAQAAVTIPTLIIGLDTGLFDITLFNAAILMILLTSITSPLIVQRFGPGIQTTTNDDKPLSLFERILFPVTNPVTHEQLLGLAALLAKANKGKVHFGHRQLSIWLY